MFWIFFYVFHAFDLINVFRYLRCFLYFRSFDFFLSIFSEFYSFLYFQCFRCYLCFICLKTSLGVKFSILPKFDIQVLGRGKREINRHESNKTNSSYVSSKSSLEIDFIFLLVYMAIFQFFTPCLQKIIEKTIFLRKLSKS